MKRVPSRAYRRTYACGHKSKRIGIVFVTHMGVQNNLCRLDIARIKSTEFSIDHTTYGVSIKLGQV
jgi:hypothetical protein